MKKKTNDKIVPKLLKGLTGILFAVSTFLYCRVCCMPKNPGLLCPRSRSFWIPAR